MPAVAGKTKVTFLASGTNGPRLSSLFEEAGLNALGLINIQQ